jgi:serine/threonine protein kinase
VQASLVHSNVVPVFDFGNLDSEYFIAQEYIVGRDLARLSDRCVEVTGSPIPPPIAYHIVCETLQALHYAHTLLGPDGRALDIVHRDVSSINIMVTSSGDVKLFDFGIAKSNTRVTRTQAGMIKGNAHFMSPEHARGQLVDARSDVFSVGLVLYFCLTNQALYSGANALEVLYKAACGPTEVELARIAALPPPAPQLLGRRPGGRSLAPLRDRSRLRQRPEPVRRRRQISGGRADAGAVRSGAAHGDGCLIDRRDRRPKLLGPLGPLPVLGAALALVPLACADPVPWSPPGCTTSSPSCGATAFTATVPGQPTRTPARWDFYDRADPRVTAIGDFSKHLISGKDPGHFVAIRGFVDPSLDDGHACRRRPPPG